MGNFYQFEAEYDSLSTLNNSNDEYFYKFNITRPGYSFPLTVDNYTWKCTPSPTSPDGGVIIDQLTYRWLEYYVGNNNSDSNGKPLKTIGPEFQFAYHNAFNDDNYLVGNKLYVSFVYKVESDEDNEDKNCMKFGLKLYGGPQGDDWHFMNLKNTISPTEQGTMFTYTAEELLSASYSELLNTDASNQFRKVTFYINLEEVQDNYLIPSSWNLKLKGIMPYVYWEGNHEIELDYVEIEDDIHKLFAQGNISTLVGDRISSVINDNSVTKFYLKDELKFPHFDSCKLIEQIFGNYPNIECMKTIDPGGWCFKKDKGERFSNLNLFVENTNQQVRNFMADYYPLRDVSDWNNVNAASNKFVQFHIDWYVSSNYRRAKKVVNNRSLYAVPITTGNWKSTSTSWGFYQYPTINMVKCLQYLPLCYGVSGIIDWKLYSGATTDTYREILLL